MDNENEHLRRYFEKIVQCYHDYKEFLKEQRNFEYFHDLRDFYSMVKYICKNSVDLNEEQMVNRIAWGFLRNFGGLHQTWDSLGKQLLTFSD